MLNIQPLDISCQVVVEEVFATRTPIVKLFVAKEVPYHHWLNVEQKAEHLAELLNCSGRLFKPVKCLDIARLDMHAIL